LVKNILELHSGSIEVNSEKDAGSTFTIRLPRKKQS
jgi:signal transduction histidine kinase